MDEVKPQEEALKLRKRLLDFQRLGAMNPESFATYQQTILQLWQEAERRRQACLTQSETFKRQAAAAESQAHAFSAMSSILYSVVNGYVEIEEKRLREIAERQAERQEIQQQEPEKQPEVTEPVKPIEQPDEPEVPEPVKPDEPLESKRKIGRPRKITSTTHA